MWTIRGVPGASETFSKAWQSSKQTMRSRRCKNCETENEFKFRDVICTTETQTSAWEGRDVDVVLIGIARLHSQPLEVALHGVHRDETERVDGDPGAKWSHTHKLGFPSSCLASSWSDPERTK